MFFKNLTLFRFDPRILADVDLARELSERRLTEPGAIELSRFGFVPPRGRGFEEYPQEYASSVGDFALVCLGKKERLLPSDVLAEELGKRIDHMHEQTGRAPGARERKRLREEIITDLLPRAFVRTTYLRAYVDKARGWLAINTSSRAAAEALVTQIRDALGSFPAVPLIPEESPRVLMTDWIATGKTPKPVILGDECELRDPVEQGAIVRCKRQELETDEVREHLRSGKQVFRTAIAFDDRLTMTLSEDLVVRQLRFTDVVRDELDKSGADDGAALFDAEFSLMSLELQRLLAWVEATFKVPGPKPRNE
jgi:recombination associated protein RdgC